MRKYKRIEITAFHRRVTIGSGPPEGGPVADVSLRNTETDEVIDPQSVEGRRNLAEAVSFLQECVADPEPEEKQ